MPLTAEQIQRFQTDGYLIVPNFFSLAEVRAIQAEVERFKRDGLLHNVATDGDGTTKTGKVKNLQLCPMAHKSDLFRSLPFDNKVVETISQLIGEPFILHLDQIFLKPGGDGVGTSWHQDNAYFKIADPMKGTAMWVAVHDATLANGTIHVIPGAFREQLPHSRDPMSDHHIRCYPDETREVPCIIPAGSAVFFCYGTPHCTKGNTTDHERAGLAFHFLHEECCHKELLAGGRDYWPFLTGPRATGGRAEYGTTVSGAWPTEVSKTLQLDAALAAR